MQSKSEQGVLSTPSEKKRNRNESTEIMPGKGNQLEI